MISLIRSIQYKIESKISSFTRYFRFADLVHPALLTAAERSVGEFKILNVYGRILQDMDAKVFPPKTF